MQLERFVRNGCGCFRSHLGVGLMEKIVVLVNKKDLCSLGSVYNILEADEAMLLVVEEGRVLWVERA